MHFLNYISHSASDGQRRRHIKPKSGQFSSRIFLWVSLFVFSFLIFKSDPVSGAKPYYYLHISSFQKKGLADKDVLRLKKKGFKAITRREKIPNKGYWYRVYIGPFSAHMEAYLKAKELKKKKITDYAAIQKKGAPIGNEFATAAAIETTSSKALKTTSKTAKTTRPEQPAKVSSSQSTSSQSSKKATSSTTKKKSSKKSSGLSKEGSGRNMGRGKFALGFRQAYQEIEPTLTKRTLTTSDGTTTTTQNVPITGTENERMTSMHISSLFFRWGLTDWFEIFGGGGVSYYEFSDFQPAFGGGLRLNLFDREGFYGALQAEYGTGKVEYEYTSITSNNWHKEADWQEFLGKGELGLAREKFSVYVGGSYLFYQEDTVRRLITNIPAPFETFAFKDVLEEKSFGAFGGFTFNLSPSFLLNFEGQGINKKGVFGSIEYKF
jgi:cell division protein FtsN